MSGNAENESPKTPRPRRVLGRSDEIHHSDGWGQRVEGKCPACGRRGFLFVAYGGHITCSIAECPNPCAVADLLEDDE